MLKTFTLSILNIGYFNNKYFKYLYAKQTITLRYHTNWTTKTQNDYHSKHGQSQNKL